MCHWRELAIEHLPGLRQVVVAASSHVDLWWSLKEFLAEAGPGQSQTAEVASIYDYAWWCVANSEEEELAGEVETFLL